MNTPEINRLTRWLEELESIQASLLTHTCVVEGEGGEPAIETLIYVWVGVVTRMQRMQNEMRDGLIKARLLAMNETEPAPKDDDSTTPKEHPEDFHLRIEYVLHAFNRMAEHCDYKDQNSQLCSHHKNNYGCFVNDCPLLIKANRSHE
jgi:hypothetical protein